MKLKKKWLNKFNWNHISPSIDCWHACNPYLHLFNIYIYIIDNNCVLYNRNDLNINQWTRAQKTQTASKQSTQRNNTNWKCAYKSWFRFLNMHKIWSKSREKKMCSLHRSENARHFSIEITLMPMIIKRDYDQKKNTIHKW